MPKKNSPLTKIANLFGYKRSENVVTKGFTDNNRYVAQYAHMLLDDYTAYNNLSSKIEQARCYKLNPILNSVLNILADAHANVRYKVRDLNSGELFDINDFVKDGGKLNKLLNNPNPIQSGSELNKQFSINYSVFGNAYEYASVPVGYEDVYGYEDIRVLNNLPPVCVEPRVTGDFLDATNIDEIITSYCYDDLKGSKREINPKVVMHMNEANIDHDLCFTQGVSKLVSLQVPLSNIQLAFEARNIQIKRRGASGILSSDKKDEGLGTISLTPNEQKELQDKYKSTYGGLSHQNDIIISPNPMRYIDMSKKTRDLMLLEEVESSAIVVCNAFGVPIDLVRYYIKNGGLSDENNANEKRLYDSTVIPQSEDRIKNLNRFLKLKEKGIELVGSFDHVKVLQANQKEEAEVEKVCSETCINDFKVGLITYGQLAIERGVELEDKKLEKLYIWDLEEDQLRAIGINSQKPKNNEESDTEV